MKGRAAKKLFHLGLRFPKTVLFLVLVSVSLSFFAASRLRVENDLMSLLPGNLDSVKALRTLKDHFGGLGYLFVTVESEWPETSADFAERFSAEIAKVPNVLYVDYKRPVDYFLGRKWLYLDQADLKEVEHRLDRAAKLKVEGLNPVFNFLMDFADIEDRPDLTFGDIFGKYEKKFGGHLQEISQDGDGRLVFFRVKLKENPQNFESTKRFMGEIRHKEELIRKEGDFSGVKVGYTGTYQKILEQTELNRWEMGFVSAVVAVALFLILFLYFGRVNSALLVCVPVAVSVLWTGGIIALTVGHLNVITSFAAAILGGVGSDYGIYLVSRFREERRRHVDFLEASERAFLKTGKGTYLSTLTTVVAFGSLLFSDFRLFVEFGIVGAVGLTLNYVAMMVLIPAWLTVEKRLGWRILFDKPKWRAALDRAFDAKARRFYDYLSSRSSRIFLVGMGLLCLLGALTVPKVSRIRFDDGQVESRKLPSYQLADRITKLSPFSLSPTALIFEGEEREAEAVRRLQSLLDAPPKDLVFDHVLGLSIFVPSGQDEKRVLIARILQKATDSNALLPGQKRDLVSGLRTSLESEPITRASLPIEVRRLFEATDRSNLQTVYLYPSFGRTDSERMKRYAEGIQGLRRTLGIPFDAADSTLMSADVVRLIESEAPKGLALVLGSLTIIALLSLKPLKRGIVIMLNLVGALFLLAGMMRLLGVDLNIINIAVIPLVLGTGIDCFVHMGERFTEEGRVREVLESKVPPTLISNLTSIVGFAGLLLTSSAGIRSAGWVSVLGILAMTVLCLLVFPQWLAHEARRAGPDRRTGAISPKI